MISGYNIESGMHFVRITWHCPKYEPERYKLAVSCEQHGIIGYQVDITLDPPCTSAEVTGLRSESICTINIVAIYNPASIDAGITINATTESNCKYSTETYIREQVCMRMHALYFIFNTSNISIA